MDTLAPISTPAPAPVAPTTMLTPVVALAPTLASEQAIADAKRVLALAAAAEPVSGYNVLLADAREAISGVSADLLGTTTRKTAVEILGYGNRLRGIGAVLVAWGLMGLVLSGFKV